MQLARLFKCSTLNSQDLVVRPARRYIINPDSQLALVEHHGRVQESNVCPLAPQPSAYHEIMISVHTYAHTYSRATWPSLSSRRAAFGGIVFDQLSTAIFSRKFLSYQEIFGNSIIIV